MTNPQAYTKQDGRKFGLTLGIAFLVLSGIVFWRGHLGAVRVLGTIATLLIVFALVLPRSLRMVDVGWMKFAELLSKVTTPIFMGIIYFGMFTFFGFFRRNFGRALKHDRGSTAWAPHEGPTSLHRQF